VALLEKLKLRDDSFGPRRSSLADALEALPKDGSVFLSGAG